MSPRAKLVLVLGGAAVLGAVAVSLALLRPPAEPPPEIAAPIPTSPLPPSPAAAKKPGAAPAVAAPAILPPPSAPRPAAPKEDDRALEAAKRESDRLAAAGDPAGALAALKKAGALAEAAAFENGLRSGFNETALKAKELAAAGKELEAAALLEARAKNTLPEIAARGAAGARRLREIDERRKAHATESERTAARSALLEELKPVPAELRARRWPETLARLDAAIADPRFRVLKEELSDERSVLALGAAFHEAFLKLLQARLNQDPALMLLGGSRLHGRLASIQKDRAVVKTGADDELDVPFDQISADQVVAWTLGGPLSPEDGLTWLKAAMFFYGEGRDDVAALYLATAKEKSAEIDAVERLWREGLLRRLLTK